VQPSLFHVLQKVPLTEASRSLKFYNHTQFQDSRLSGASAAQPHKFVCYVVIAKLQEIKSYVVGVVSNGTSLSGFINISHLVQKLERQPGVC
jgi:hypothetical protein